MSDYILSNRISVNHTSVLCSFRYYKITPNTYTVQGGQNCYSEISVLSLKAFNTCEDPTIIAIDNGVNKAAVLFFIEEHFLITGKDTETIEILTSPCHIISSD